MLLRLEVRTLGAQHAIFVERGGINDSNSYGHSFKAAAYDNGTRHGQVTLACDVTYHF